MAKKAAAKKKAAAAKSESGIIKKSDLRPIAIVGFGLLIASLVTQVMLYMQVADKTTLDPMVYIGMSCLLLGGLLASLALYHK